MPGYSIFEEDLKSLDRKYLCTSCKKPMRAPIKTVCGHRYCMQCIEDLLRSSNSRCVEDTTEIRREELNFDKFVEREIQSLSFHCTNHSDGCDWRGNLSQLEEHQVECPYVKIPCVHHGCGVLVMRGDLSRHVEECSFRQEQCQSRSLLANAVVPKGPTSQQMEELSELQADTNCTRLLLQSAVSLSKEVESLLMPDPNIVSRNPPISTNHNQLDQAQNGTEEVRSLTSHFPGVRGQRSVNGEGSLPNRELTRRLTNLEDRTADNQVLLQEDIENLTQQLRLLEETVGTQQHQLVENERYRDDGRMEVELLAQSIASLKRILTDVQAVCSRLSVNVEDGIPNAEAPRRPSSYENRMTGQEEIRRQVAALRRELETSQETTRRQEETIRQLEATSYDGVLLWKISDYAQRRNDATTERQPAFYSPCFYTSRYGYKMCARLYLNGDGMGKGTHISLFFIVMHGQYDGVLHWPFRQKVTMMLLDQDNVEHVIHSFTPDPNSSSFQRPRREMNVASGCPTFCPLSELNSHAYVRDGTMFLKIIVDT